MRIDPRGSQRVFISVGVVIRRQERKGRLFPGTIREDFTGQRRVRSGG